MYILTDCKSTNQHLGVGSHQPNIASAAASFEVKSLGKTRVLKGFLGGIIQNEDINFLLATIEFRVSMKL